MHKQIDTYRIGLLQRGKRSSSFFQIRADEAKEASSILGFPFQSRFSNCRVCRKCEKVKEKYIKESIVEEDGTENCRKENMRDIEKPNFEKKGVFDFWRRRTKKKTQTLTILSISLSEWDIYVPAESNGQKYKDIYQCS